MLVFVALSLKNLIKKFEKRTKPLLLAVQGLKIYDPLNKAFTNADFLKT